MTSSVPKGGTLRRGGLLVLGSSVLLTAALIGIIAVVSDGVEGFGGRAPFYLLVTAVVFVALVIIFEGQEFDGKTILLSTVGLAMMFGILVTFAGEGFVHTLRHPFTVLSSRLLVYLLATGVVCTGLAYWGLRHWREFVPQQPP